MSKRCDGSAQRWWDWSDRARRRRGARVRRSVSQPMTPSTICSAHRGCGEMRAVADIGSHWLDLIGFIAGQRVTRVFADFVTILPIRRKPTRPVETFAGKELAPDEYEERSIRTEDSATVLLRFADGAPGVMTVSQVSAGHKNRLVFEIGGADASVAWNSERPEELWIGHRERASELLQRDPALLAPE